MQCDALQRAKKKLSGRHLSRFCHGYYSVAALTALRLLSVAGGGATVEILLRAAAQDYFQRWRPGIGVVRPHLIHIHPRGSRQLLGRQRLNT